MDILRVNEYYNAATEALLNDREYACWFGELVKCRLEARTCDYNTGTIESVLYELESLRLGYILEHLEEIELLISSRYK